jgi:hypothetical protein
MQYFFPSLPCLIFLKLVILSGLLSFNKREAIAQPRTNDLTTQGIHRRCMTYAARSSQQDYAASSWDLQGGNSMIQALSLVTPRQAVLLTEIFQSLIWKALWNHDHHAVTL